jgi:ubiquinone/menaquinone biosynthesis C-methylase UbiE
MDRGPYVHALHYSALTRFYDTLIKVTLREERIKGALVGQLELADGHRVLDLGCGTGTLAIMIKSASPGTKVIGLDGDEEVLRIAEQKAEHGGVRIEWRRGMSFEPPFPDGSFDRIVSSLLFHHLSRDDKLRTLARARSLLAKGGRLHVLDWGEAGSFWMRAAFLSVQLLDGFSTTSDNVKGLLMEHMRASGFSSVTEVERARTVFGTLSYYRAEP